MFLTSIDIPVVPVEETPRYWEMFLHEGLLMVLIPIVGIFLIVSAIFALLGKFKIRFIPALMLSIFIGALSAHTLTASSFIDRNYEIQHNKTVNFEKAVSDTKTLAESKILSEYNLEKEATDFTHVLKDQKLVESSTTYDDLESKTRYELVFVFDKDQNAVLLKTATVTDDLINKLQK